MTSIVTGNVGMVFTATITENSTAVDISGATGTGFVFTRPNRTTVTVASTFVSDGSDGRVTYSSTSGLLSVPGVWRYQAYINGVGAWSGHSESKHFRVYPRAST